MRPREPSKRRLQDIIDAAAEIFQQQGYSDASVDSIAKAVGLLKGSLYYYIDSKEDLLFHVLLDVHDGALEIVEEVSALDLPAIEKLRRYIAGHVEYNTRNVTKIAVFYHDYRALSAPRLKEVIAHRKVFEEFVQRLIEEAQREGDVDPGIDPKIASFALFGMMNWVYQWYRPRGAWKPDQLGRFYAELAIEGLTGASPEPR